MDYVINITKILLCSVSMTLTGLFAISFSNNSIEGSSQLIGVISLGLMLSVGIALDLCKYIFWTSSRFRIIAGVLLLFSWLASVSFFISHEQQVVQQARKDTSSYLAFTAQIESLRNEIKSKQTLMENRLSSKFHKKWEEADHDSEEISELNRKLNQLIKSENSIGVTETTDLVSSFAFFVSIGKLTDTSAETIRSIFYAILALLIEICSLGVISFHIVHKQKNELENPALLSVEEIKEHLPLEKVVEEPQLKTVIDSLSELDEESQRLWSNILNGKIEPIFRRIKDAEYDLTEREIRSLLQKMKGAGFLIDGPRRSLQLA